MSECFARGLRCIEREDDVVLLSLRARSAPKRADWLILLLERALAATLSPNGSAALLIPAHCYAEAILSLPPDVCVRVIRDLSAIRISGAGMSGGGNLAGRICSVLAHAGIHARVASLCDLALTIAVKETDAARAVELISSAIPLTV